MHPRQIYGGALAILAVLVTLLAVVATLARRVSEAYANDASAASAASAASEAAVVRQAATVDRGDPYDGYKDLNVLGNDVMCNTAPWKCKGRLFDVLTDVAVHDRVAFLTPHEDPTAAAAASYSLQKEGPDANASAASSPGSLRLTVGGSGSSSMSGGLEVWGDACSLGDCGGPGRWQHRLRADGDAGHRGSLVVGSETARAAQDGRGGSGSDFGISSYNPVTAAYSHFPSRADGRNHVSGDLVLDAKVCMKGSESCLDAGDLGAVLGIPRLQQDLGVVLRNQVTQAANAADQKVALQAALKKSAEALKNQLASGAPR